MWEGRPAGMDRRHLPDFSRLAPGREATGVYQEEVQGKFCRQLYPTNPEAQATCILNAMAQEAEWAAFVPESRRKSAGLRCARPVPAQ